MDNVTHSLTGLAMARAGLDRLCPRATLLLLVSANIPDIDVVGLLGGQLNYLEMHRGYTHTILGLPAMALVSVLVVAAIYRQRLPWLRAWLLSCAGVASHLLLDWTNSYGVRPFLPFTSEWFHLDLNGLWDGAILAVLFFALVWPFLGGLVSQEIGERSSTRGRGVAVFALCFLLLYDCGRGLLHARVLAQLNSRVYNGEEPLNVSALPDSVNPLVWTGIVEVPESFRLFHMRAFDEFNPNESIVFFKRRIDAGISSVSKTEPFRYFLYFARFPVWYEGPSNSDQGETKKIQLSDLRFGTPAGPGFRAMALLDEHSRILRSWFQF